MRKTLLVSMLLLGFASIAEARPNSWDMTCSEARALVRSKGAVVMNHGYHSRAGFLYDRYVKNGNYCFSGEQAVAAWVPTSDKARCWVGYVCRYHDHGD
jgi:hypothetical protein